ncbi:MAG: hypothetical protein KGL39_24625 [Patescibacteria group bacterium]|nr:hypothetical protein [Patescibacteria group bacterium]
MTTNENTAVEAPQADSPTRRTYRPLTDTEKELIDHFKIGIDAEIRYMRQLQRSFAVTGMLERVKMLELSETKLEEAKMWFVKAITS